MNKYFITFTKIENNTWDIVLLIIHYSKCWNIVYLTITIYQSVNLNYIIVVLKFVTDQRRVAFRLKSTYFYVIWFRNWYMFRDHAWLFIFRCRLKLIIHVNSWSIYIDISWKVFWSFESMNVRKSVINMEINNLQSSLYPTFNH